MQTRHRSGALPLLLFFLLHSPVFAQDSSVQVVVRGFSLELQWFTQDIVRVRVYPGAIPPDRKSLSVIASPQRTEFKKTETDFTVTVSTGRLVITIDKRDGALKFFNNNGGLLLSAKGLEAKALVGASENGENFYHVSQTFTLSDDEGIYGLGQFEDPVVNYRGQDILIAQANRTAVNPFLVSTRGYGILWDNTSKSRFRDSPQGASFWSEVADQIDYYVVYGPAPDKVVAGYRLLTGKAPLFGKWAYGFWQSKERYKTGAELLGVLREYRHRGIPLDNIVQDWSYWGGMDQFSGMVWDSTTFPAPSKMIDTIHQANAHLMVSIWPAFGEKTEIYRAMLSEGFLYSPIHWNNGRVYDAFNPEARDLYWQYLKKGLFDIGVDAYWMDATEPEFRCTDDRYITELSMKSGGRTFLGSFARYLNAYSLMTTRGVYEHHREATDKKRVMILTRSSYAGQQRYAAATWSGDTFASWDNLKVQIASGINFSMSGIPYWTHDIGGFNTDFHFPRGLSDPAYKELFVRWFQFGAFCPIFRAHGTSIPREMWNFGSRGDWAYDALVDADRLRYRLMPYIYSVAWRVTHDDYSILRGLPMSFPDDRRTHSLSAQYMFGPSLMVCPVTRPMQYPPEYKGIDITPNHFYSADDDEHGVELQVYRGTDFDSLLLVRRTDVGQISWLGCLPVGLDTSYSIRLQGRIMSESRGKYALYVITDGGVRFWIDNKLLIDESSNSVRKTLATSIDLNALTKYAFRLEYRQFKPNNALLRINWEKPEASPGDQKTIEVYLPQDARWFDFWSGTLTNGGQTVHADAPINRLPLFVPAGSIIPMGPDIQYANEQSNGPIELRIYPGKNADFTLYDDEGDGYNYEKAAYTLIPFHWDDPNRTLTIGSQQGTFPGAPASRKFNIVLVRENHGVGGGSTPQPDKAVPYKGKAISVRP
jgi:alpha-D-xyloside xylohydrolase